ncbi:MAG: hypothetical protein Q4G63_12985 [Bacteroidia bacterium]|nr:hypothetical protein [Bacteroidia bacterium]
MVLYSSQALNDFDIIFEGLLHWEKIKLSEQFTIDYVNDIKTECEKIPYKSYHENTTYKTHKLHGQKVHRYHRNPHTTWYILYDMDTKGTVFVNRIISNYTTVE